VVQGFVAEQDFWNSDLVTIITFDDAPTRATVLAEPEADNHGHLRLRWEDNTSDDILWTRRFASPLETCGEIDTDAGLVHIQKKEDGELQQALLYNGSYLTPWQTGPLLPRCTQVIRG
jgi:hypothetical protein